MYLHRYIRHGRENCISEAEKSFKFVRKRSSRRDAGAQRGENSGIRGRKIRFFGKNVARPQFKKKKIKTPQEKAVRKPEGLLKHVSCMTGSVNMYGFYEKRT
jgi:hypothetical protein